MSESIHHDAQQPLGIDQARALLLERIAPVAGRETLPSRSALGRVLARELSARFNVPAHDSSAMDGYAARAADLSQPQNTLRLVGSAQPGKPFSGVVGAGQTVRIQTGAHMPRGADCVVMREQVLENRADAQQVVLPALESAAQHVRQAGEDLAAGEVALAAGTRIGPAELGLIASLGYAEVCVHRRPRIAILATGDELTSIGHPLSPGEVYDSNRYTLHGALQQLGVEICDMGVVRDDPAALRAALAEATLQADAVLTTGGVSASDCEHLHGLLEGMGELCFWQLDIKPGRPMAFGRIGTTWLFGLPGNPVAALVNYYQLVLVGLNRLAGLDPLPPRPSFRVRCAEPVRHAGRRREFPRGVLFEHNGEWRVRLTSRRGSGVLRSMVEGNCFIILPQDGGDVQADDWVEVQPFSLLT